MQNSPVQGQNHLGLYKFERGQCMHGTVQQRKDNGQWFVLWYDSKKKKQFKIYKYFGQRIGDKKTAYKLLSLMQNDVERLQGGFKIEKFINPDWSSILELLEQWENQHFKRLTPSTAKTYRSYLKIWIKPFFEDEKRMDLNIGDIQLDVIYQLLDSIPRAGKTKQNIIYAFHEFMDYCWRCGRIAFVPPFPKKEVYGVEIPPIKWLPEVRQMAVLERIPDVHKPIFYFMKYTLRRPCEAMTIHKEDLIYHEDGEINYFRIHRSLSARVVIDKTKTKKEHKIACHDALIPFIKKALKAPIISEFLFTNESSKCKGKRYSSGVINKLWKQACIDAGESIPLYSGLKHSSASQYINEKGLTKYELKEITDHARLESVDRYAVTEVSRKKALIMTLPLGIKEDVEDKKQAK